MLIFIVAIYIILSFKCETEAKKGGYFPKDIPYGFGSSAYQFEGAWNEDGRGPSIWDTFTHKIPSPIKNNDSADVACDFYHRYKEDIKLAADLGAKLYRFSISWSRVLPSGYAYNLNEKGIQYYKNLVTEILKYNMSPVATLYHWDLPQGLYDNGIDWTNPDIIPHFVNYSRIVIQNLPKVQFWLTINEPKQICHWGYGVGYMPPNVKSDGVLEYKCTYVVLKAHAAVYRMYKSEFPHYEGKMSLTLDCNWMEPLTKNFEDVDAASRRQQFECGLYYHPIVRGDWPYIVKYRIYLRSKNANLPESRLPEFSLREIADIRGTYDFLGVNHYLTYLVKDEKEAPFTNISYANDVRIDSSYDIEGNKQDKEVSMLVPFGIKNVLNWITKEYGNIPILITEIGTSDNGTMFNDVHRIDFVTDYLCTVLEAINDGVNVTGITFWSLTDNFEWIVGYSQCYGFYQIDFKNPFLPRMPRRSVSFIKNYLQTGMLKCNESRIMWPNRIKLPTLEEINLYG
ncbi:myrosinase 1-like [Diabrotica undecimpunctata]|uniref:myrosinase 1-like n=1 Tax=Diabrotica undecimpunctata TaxID=50387 RepID=UPI003B63BAE2